jgi:hypothetical protein
MGEIDLGDKARDRITGYTGIVTAKTVWLNGCVRLSLQRIELDKDGKPYDTQTFDIEQLELLDAAAVPSSNRNKVAAPAAITGGPRPEIPRR